MFSRFIKVNVSFSKDSMIAWNSPSILRLLSEATSVVNWYSVLMSSFSAAAAIVSSRIPAAATKRALNGVWDREHFICYSS